MNDERAVPLTKGSAVAVSREPGEAAALLDSLEELRRHVSGLNLVLSLPEAPIARRDRDRLVDQLDDYLLPRLRQLDAPLLAVVGGSTGAGKSTLVNSLLRERVSRSGVLRPTTRSPVLVHHRDDAEWFVGDRILPTLARLTGADSEPSRADEARKITSVRLAQTTALPQGLALLDAPDIDSVVDANRQLANQLLAAGDLWLFVTTAARYADAVPWDLLRVAGSRGTSVAVVLDRVPPQAIAEIEPDLASMLRTNGLEGAPLFVVPETDVDEDGFLPRIAVAQLRAWLVELASSAQARQTVVKRTLGGALDSLRARMPALATAAKAQADADRQLRAEISAAFADADEDLAKGLTDGSLLRGEVLARWHEYIGTGEFFRNLDQTIGRWRDRLGAMLSGRPAPADNLGEALHTGVAALVHSAAEQALETSARRLRDHPAGRGLLASTPETSLTRLSDDFDLEVERLVRDWQGFVLDLVREEGADRRTQARILSFGVNGLAVVLMLVVFASTALIPTGAEVGVGAGTAVVGQRLLEAIFGEQAVRTLAKRARIDLRERINALMDREMQRILSILDDQHIDPDAAKLLMDAADQVQAARVRLG
ncbi:MAG: dynamin family protein [Microlunatus sp.]|nr:dynamin family protein [Microlunatus sp.]